ncbi:type II toxin-antitoxin system VapC family toxin [soil metagenome]
MTITPDTNLLVRVVVLDDAAQTEQARAELSMAEAVVLTLPALCEFCWVLKSRYRFSSDQLGQAILALMSAENARYDADAVEAGLAMINAGGDFADAVIANQGRRQGSQAFVSFDRQAVTLLTKAGQSARLPA